MNRIIRLIVHDLAIHFHFDEEEAIQHLLESTETTIKEEKKPKEPRAQGAWSQRNLGPKSLRSLGAWAQRAHGPRAYGPRVQGPRSLGPP